MLLLLKKPWPSKSACHDINNIFNFCSFRVKQRLHEYMRTDTDTAEELSKKVFIDIFIKFVLWFMQLNPTGAASNKVALDAIKNPVNACQQLYEKIEILIERISELEAASKEGSRLDKIMYGLMTLLISTRKSVFVRKLEADACEMGQTGKGK